MTNEPFDRVNPDNGISATAVTFYGALYPSLREAARRHGYALALHGSLARDLDVVAIAWVEEAAPVDVLVRALVEASGGFTVGGVTQKPRGRLSIIIALGAEGGFVDLSIVGAP